MSREKKFTPGPWEVQTFESGLTDITAHPLSAWAIAEQVLQKNSHLIAAAPELLEALEEAERFFNNVVTGNDTRSQSDKVRSMMDTAIKKAYGETP